MKKLFILILIAGVSLKAAAQQIQTTAFPQIQGFMHNASFAGLGATNFVGANYRTQWSEISGGPKTASLFGSFAMPSSKMGMSALVYSDKTGPTSRTGLSVSFAKHIDFGNGSVLSLGIENKFQQFRLDQEKLTAAIGTDPAIANAKGGLNYDAGFGISFTNKNLQVGLSVAQLLESELKNYSGSASRTDVGKLYRHYYLTGAYSIKMNEDITMIPNLLLIYLPNTPAEFNAGAQIIFKENIRVGASASKNFSINFGATLSKNFSVDYAFDLYSNDNVLNNLTANEFMLRYHFKR
jgi:type IX secretion system PorP/SprF family membrane protein